MQEICLDWSCLGIRDNVKSSDWLSSFHGVSVQKKEESKMLRAFPHYHKKVKSEVKRWRRATVGS